VVRGTKTAKVTVFTVTKFQLYHYTLPEELLDMTPAAKKYKILHYMCEIKTGNLHVEYTL